MQQLGCIPQLRAKQNLSKSPANPRSIWFSFQKVTARGKHLTEAVLPMLHQLLLSKQGPYLSPEGGSGPFFPACITCLFNLPCLSTLFMGFLLPLRKGWTLPPSSSNVSDCCPFWSTQSMFSENLNTSWPNELNQRCWRETVQMKQIISLTTLQTFAAFS